MHPSLDCTRHPPFVNLDLYACREFADALWPGYLTERLAQVADRCLVTARFEVLIFNIGTGFRIGGFESAIDMILAPLPDH